MNIVAYDNLEDKIDKNKTWIDFKRHRILSRELKYRKHYTFLQRYDPDCASVNYFLCVSDEPINTNSFKSKKDEYGRFIINITPLLAQGIYTTVKKDVNISLKCIDTQEDGEVYELEML